MMDAMFEVPSDDEVKECIITKESVTGDEEPMLVLDNNETRRTSRRTKNEIAQALWKARKQGDYANPSVSVIEEAEWRQDIKWKKIQMWQTKWKEFPQLH